MDAGIDFIGCSVFGLIFNDKDEVLLVDHFLTDKKPKGLSDCWSMPGGTIKFGEKAEDTLKREIAEELGIQISNIRLINYNEFIKNNRHWFALNFTAKTNDEPKILELEKIKAIKFFSLNNIPDNLSDFCRDCLGIIKEKNEQNS